MERHLGGYGEGAVGGCALAATPAATPRMAGGGHAPGSCLWRARASSWRSDRISAIRKRLIVPSNLASMQLCASHRTGHRRSGFPCFRRKLTAQGVPGAEAYDMVKAMRHTYATRVTWTGNKGRGTSAYGAYARDYDVACTGKPALRGSADLRYLGDADRHNPEDLLVAALVCLSHAVVPAPLRGQRRRGHGI